MHIYHLAYVLHRFGIRAVFFLIASKFRKDRCSNIKIRGIKSKIYLSNFTFDVTTLFQIFYAKEYEINLGKEPEWIIDCGANIGLSTIFFANKYPTCKIIAIEPDGKNFQYLKRNTRRYPNIVCIQKAVWSHITKLAVIDTGKGNWGLQTKESTSLMHEFVDAITIDAILKKYKIGAIDLLKIDIEGAEKELFSKNFDSWLSKTNVIAIELHDFLESGIKSVFDSAIAPYCHKRYSNGENLICEL
jgi:FkbM family methyltransferase